MTPSDGTPGRDRIVQHLNDVGDADVEAGGVYADARRKARLAADRRARPEAEGTEEALRASLDPALVHLIDDISLFVRAGLTPTAAAERLGAYQPNLVQAALTEYLA